MSEPGYSAPFPWFGGKSRVASLVWERFGDVAHYVEPFFGSGAVLLGRLDWSSDSSAVETVNDKDGFIANVFRAIRQEPAAVVEWADWPVNEADLHARHCWLLERRDALVDRLMGDPNFCDAKIAGWWLWGVNCWIGSGWCRGDGPWGSVEVAPGDRQLVHLGDAGMGVHRKRVHLGSAGMGVHRKRVHLGDAGRGVHRKLVHLGSAGRGVHRKLVHLGSAGRGDGAGFGAAGLDAWIAALSERLRRVRVCCGDWMRICDSEAALFPARGQTTGVFLDPPYSTDERTDGLYAQDDGEVAAAVRDWCVRWGADPRLRIVLCGYDGEGHEALAAAGWTQTAWKAHGGYGSQGDGGEGSGDGRANKLRERLWWSPACIPVKQCDLFVEAPR